MSDDVRDIADFYNRDPEQEQMRLGAHQLEYDLTWRYLERYLPARGSVLEIGAATGRYTLELAKRGYAVTAVDMSAALLERCGKRLAEQRLGKHVRRILADARDLGQVTERDFDAVLLMGPLYHLILEDDRKQALGQAVERLRAGGMLFSAFISRYGILGDLIKNVPNWIEGQHEVRSVLEIGKDPDDFPRGGFRGYFARVPEIAPLHEAAGLKTIALAGVEPAISADDESYNSLEGQRRLMWLDLLEEISTEPSSIAASRHLLYVGQKC